MFMVLCWNVLDANGDLRRVRSAGRVSFYASGVHNGSGGASMLKNTEAKWTVDGFVGSGDVERVIHNLTDGGSGVVTANTATEVTATLVGGISNYWSPGDQYEIRFSQMTQYDASGSVRKFQRELKSEKAFYDIVTGNFSDIFETIVRVSPEIGQYLDENAIWTDSLTGLKGPPSIMMGLSHERELYNNPQNPLHVPGFKGVVKRVGEYDTIHSPIGWHQQQIIEARYHKPESMLVYYGHLNSFNSTVNTNNGWDNQKVAKEFAKYNVLVFGNGVADSGHADYANAQIIVSRIKVLNPATKIFGYVDTTLSQVDFESQVDDWIVLGVTGIFMDRAGYDFGIDRSGFNSRVDYIHDEGLIVMANCWNQDHVVGQVNDVNYPNVTFNANSRVSSLNSNDYYLLESAPINNDAYAGADGYQSASDWAARGVKAIGHRSTYGLKVAACGIIDDANVDGQDLFDFGFIAAYMFSLEAFGTSHSSYGSGIPRSKWWTRPSVLGLGNCNWLNPSVQVDIPDTDVYYRYTQFGRLTIDFSSGAQLSSIEKW